jgi:hypothetical protein
MLRVEGMRGRCERGLWDGADTRHSLCAFEAGDYKDRWKGNSLRRFGGAEWGQLAGRGDVVVEGVHSSHSSYVWLLPRMWQGAELGYLGPGRRDLTTTAPTARHERRALQLELHLSHRRSLDRLRAFACPRAHAATLARCLYQPAPDVTTPAAYLIFDSCPHTA